MELVNRQDGLTEKDLEYLVRNALVVKPEYLHLPSPTNNYIDLETYAVSATKKAIANFEDKLIGDLTSRGMDRKMALNFSSAVSEALHNAADHVYKWDATKNIIVEAIFMNDYDIIGVQSQGKSLDIDLAKKRIKETSEAVEKFKKDPKNGLKYVMGDRGRGFYIMTECCHMVYPNQPYEDYTDLLLIMVKNKSPVVYMKNGKDAKT